MRSFKKIKINMYQDSLDNLIKAYLSDIFPSRTSVSETAGVSKATASKVAGALVDSGFMCEKLYSRDGKERPRLHLSLSDSVRILLIDFSTPRYRMSILSNNASVLFESTYSYDSSIPFDDNVNIFLSRCGLSIKHSSHSFSAISVLYPDREQKAYMESVVCKSTLPLIHDKDAISRAIYEIFRKAPDTHLTVCDAICEALKYNTSTVNARGVSYIFAGSRSLAFHSYSDGSKTICAPEKLLSDNEKTVIQCPHLASKDDIDALFVKLCRFMDAAFTPSVIILDSDIYTPDKETSRKITRAFALAGQNAPLIKAREADMQNSIHLSGVLKCTVFSLIKRHISNT